MLLFPDAGTNVAAHTGSPEHDEKLFDELRRRRVGNRQQSAHGAVPARAALLRRRARPRREAHRLALDADAAPGPHGARSDARARQKTRCASSALDVGGGFGAKMLGVEELLLGWVALKVGKPVRWTETRSESMVALPHGRAQRMDFTIGGTQGRQGARVPARVAAGRRRVSGARSVPAEPDGADVERRLRHPADRVRRPRGGDEHDAHLGLPRCGPAGGDTGDRACDGHVRGRARDGPGRGQAAKLHPEGRVPLHHGDPCGLRLGRLRRCARPRAPRGRLRRAA